MSLVLSSKRVAAVAAAACVLTLSAACSSGSGGAGAAGSSEGGSGSGLPPTIKVLNIEDLSTNLAFAGTPAKNGIALAVSEINSQHFLGNTKISVDSKDAQSKAQTAASFATTAVNDPSYSAILGPLYSAEAQAVAPIAQKAGIPMIATQAGSDGVLIGPYTYRATASIGRLYDKTLGYLQSKSVKKLDVIYASDNPTEVDVTTKTLPSLVGKHKISLGQTVGVPSTAQDLTSPVGKIVADKPDAVSVLVVGTQNGTVTQQLRQQGFTGEIVAATPAGSGNLKPAGQAGVGVVWTTDFSAAQTDPAAAAFTKAYTEAYGTAPTNYAAEGYDSAWFLARAIKAAKSGSRSDIQAALQHLAKTGFDGAQGKLSFTSDNDLVVPGVLVKWNGTAEELVSGS